MISLRTLRRGLAPAALLLVAGCQAPGPAVPAGRELRDDIVAIQQYPPTNPWLRDEEGRIVGIRTRVYFVPSAGERDLPKGVFVPGVIKATLYAMISHADGTTARELVTEWSFDQHQAEGLRIVTPSVMGESYGLILRWPASADVAGREIQVVIGYQPIDGESVVRRGTRFRVPLPLGAASPRTGTAAGAPDRAPLAPGRS